MDQEEENALLLLFQNISKVKRRHLDVYPLYNTSSSSDKSI